MSSRKTSNARGWQFRPSDMSPLSIDRKDVAYYCSDCG